MQTADPLIGTTIGGSYSVKSLLNEGGTSRIYLARHTTMEKMVVIKLLRPELQCDDAQAARLQREARAIAGLNHPNLVSIMGTGTTSDDRFFLVLEYLQGRTLGQWIDDEGAVAPPRAVAIFRQICDAMQYVHDRGIIDRDLSPTNIMLIKGAGMQDFVKLVDLGMLKYDSSLTAASRKLTLTGDVMGNPMYISPEQALARTVDLRTDIYSLGTIMWETLTGKPLFSGSSIGAIMNQHAHTPAPTLSRARPDLSFPPALEQTVMKCLNKEPDDRYATMDELSLALADYAKPIAIAPAPVPKLLTIASTSSWQTAKDLLVAALAAACAAVVLCLLLSQVVPK